jgi:hypothetical protein
VEAFGEYEYELPLSADVTEGLHSSCMHVTHTFFDKTCHGMNRDNETVAAERCECAVL